MSKKLDHSYLDWTIAGFELDLNIRLDYEVAGFLKKTHELKENIELQVKEMGLETRDFEDSLLRTSLSASKRDYKDNQEKIKKLQFIKENNGNCVPRRLALRGFGPHSKTCACSYTGDKNVLCFCKSYPICCVKILKKYEQKD